MEMSVLDCGDSYMLLSLSNFMNRTGKRQE